MKENYIIIDTQDLMDEFLQRVGYFHDALIKEVAIANRGYVDQNGWMSGDMAPCDARLVFHSQYPEPACIDMVFTALIKFRLEDYHVLSGDAKGVVTQNTVCINFGDAHSSDDYMISAGAMKYRILGRDELGDRILAIQEISVDEDYCPACGYKELWFKPWDGNSAADEICPCCGIQFGLDDYANNNLLERSRIHKRWRKDWIDAGMPWRGKGQAPPEDWNPDEQLQHFDT